MADKSPRSHMSKKGKSIKEKRAEKHARPDTKGHLDIGDIGKKRRDRQEALRTSAPAVPRDGQMADGHGGVCAGCWPT